LKTANSIPQHFFGASTARLPPEHLDNDGIVEHKDHLAPTNPLLACAA
jgi:hypothetical protein